MGHTFDSERKAALSLLSDNRLNLGVDCEETSLARDAALQRENSWKLQREQMERNRTYSEQTLLEEVLHTHQCLLHYHPVALSCELTVRGQPRTSVAKCSSSSNLYCNYTPLWSCGKCNWDVCQNCYEIAMIPPYERASRIAKIEQDIALQKREARNQTILEQVQRRHQWEEEEAAMFDKFKNKYSKLSFTPNVIQPAQENLNTKCRFAYVVLYSDSFLKLDDTLPEFDSSFQEFDEAHARAVYLFFLLNPWGFTYAEMLEQTVTEAYHQGQLPYYSVSPQ